MLETLFNSRTKERVLLFIYTHREGYAKKISRELSLPLRSVQLQLKRMENGGVLVCKKTDRALIYQFNPLYPFYKELKTMLEKLLSLLPERDRENNFTPRLRPRKIGKPL